jgi:rare lipoprotein A
MSGRHAEGHTARPSRPSLPIVAGAVLAVLLIGAAVASLRLGPATDPKPADTKRAAADTRPPPLTASASPGTAAPTTASPEPTRTDDRAGRSELRAAPSKSPTPAPANRTPPPGGGTVTGSGTCGASFYSDGQRTANGEIFNPKDFTAAHKTLPFNTRLRVTNLANGKSTVVRINDRGPFVQGRCLDLSEASFGAIASLSSGVANVRYEILG